MIRSIRFLSAALLFAAFSGCAAQKSADHSGSGSIIHAQAMKAIEQRRFRIDIDEIFPHAGKPAVTVTGSFISCDGNQGIMYFVPSAFPRKPLKNLTVNGNRTEVELLKIKKNGDKQYSIRAYADSEKRKGIALVTLYAGSNRCLIQFWGADFRGRLYPLEE